MHVNPPPTFPAHAAPWRQQVRQHLFASKSALLTTLLVGALLAWLLFHGFDWAVLRAHWQPQADACRQEGAGACWAVVREKYRLILFGRYPFEEHWRPLMATVLLLGLLTVSALRRFWRRTLPAFWLGALLVCFVLLYGGMLGLSVVETDRWGGLPLTLLLATLSSVLAFPLALLLALGRQAEQLPLIRSACVVYIEVVRGVPLVSVLFMAAFMAPLLMPQGVHIDVLLRVLAGISLFAAAYMAEVIRGGLQAIPRSQRDAAEALGLTWWQTQRLVVLPQALTAVIPGLVNNFIGIFKDTSLVTIVSLYELTGSLSLALNSDADWRPYKREAYLFIALIYFVFCFALSRYSLRLERQLKRP